MGKRRRTASSAPFLASSWLALGWQAAQLAMNAQCVIALRMMRLAHGGAAGRSEAKRMLHEKAEALAQAQVAAAAAAMSGRKAAAVARTALSIYGKRVRGNRRRLLRRK
jgi:hypothetical protein